MAGGLQELPRPPIPRPGALYGLLALLGASMVVSSVVGKPRPPVHAGCALAGFLLWIVGVVLTLLHIRRPRNLKSLLVWDLTNPAPAPADGTVAADYGVPFRRLTGHSHFVQDVVLSSDGQFAPLRNLKRFLFSGPGAPPPELLRPPISRPGSLYGFLALLGASVVVSSVVGKPRPPVHAGCALAGFLLWIVGVVLMLLHIRRPRNLKLVLVWDPTNPAPAPADDGTVATDYGVPFRRLTGHCHFVQDVVLSSDGQFAPLRNLKRFLFSGSGAPQPELLRPPISRPGALYGFLALLGASAVVPSVVGKPRPPVHAGCALAGFLLWILGLVLMLLHIRRPQNLKLFFFSGPGALAPAPA